MLPYSGYCLPVEQSQKTTDKPVTVKGILRNADSLDNAVGGCEHVAVSDEHSTTELGGSISQQGSNPRPLQRVSRLASHDPSWRWLSD